MTTTPYYFTPRPLFGFDIGKGSLKAVQLSTDDEQMPKLVGYGMAQFDPAAIKDGVIMQPEIIAEAAQSLFKKDLIGDITTRRAAFTIPSQRTFTRSMRLPALKPRELSEAVRLEAEQYIPTPLQELQLDYTVIERSKDSLEVLLVAAGSSIIDSYVALSRIMGLEIVLIEPTMNAIGRLFSRDKQSDVASVIIDFGSLSSDISIYDHGVFTTGTVEGGGEVFSDVIQSALGVTRAEASIIKSKYGLGKSRRQDEIKTALDPTLQKISKEIKRLVRYHQEHRGDKRPIGQVITVGGGANLPGLNDYFTSELRLAVRAIDPWRNLEHSRLQLPGHQDRSMYASAIGVCLAEPAGVFA